MPPWEIDNNTPYPNADNTLSVEYIPDINGLRITDLRTHNIIHEIVVDDAFVLSYPVVWHPSEAILFFTVDDYNNEYYTLQAVDLRGNIPEYHIIFAGDWLSHVNSIVWHPNGDHFATAHRDGAIRLWQEIR